VYRITKLKKRPGPNKGLYSHLRMNETRENASVQNPECSRMVTETQSLQQADTQQWFYLSLVTFSTPVTVYRAAFLVISPRSSEKTQRLSLASAGFLLGLLFDPEDGVDMLLRIAGLFPTTQRYNPTGRTFLLLHKGKKVKLSMTTYGGVEVQLHLSWPRHYMAVSGQLHDFAALPPEKEPPLHIGHETEWAPGAGHWRREKKVLHCREWNPGRPARRYTDCFCCSICHTERSTDWRLGRWAQEAAHGHW
jgi:hypothetical protein